MILSPSLHVDDYLTKLSNYLALNSLSIYFIIFCPFAADGQTDDDDSAIEEQ